MVNAASKCIVHLQNISATNKYIYISKTVLVKIRNSISQQHGKKFGNAISNIENYNKGQLPVLKIKASLQNLPFYCLSARIVMAETNRGWRRSTCVQQRSLPGTVRTHTDFLRNPSPSPYLYPTILSKEPLFILW